MAAILGALISDKKLYFEQYLLNTHWYYTLQIHGITKGPYEIKEVVNRMDYKVDIEGNLKILHANILTAYQEREASEVGMTVHEEECHCTTVIEEEGEGDDVIKDEGWLEFRPDKGEETYKDVNIRTKLSKRQKKQAWELLKEYQDILTSNPGKTSLREHCIEVTTDQPIRTKAYLLPYAVRELIKKEVNEMLRMGIIEPSNSAYSSSVVMVKKKDGSNRFCVDYRKLNAVTKFDNEPMGDPEELMVKLRNDKFFTKIDMSKGYWQIPMEEGSKTKTAFTISSGCYQFKRMPFGLMNAAATFNRVMRKMLNRAQNIDHFIDDVLTHNATWEDHIKALKALFQRVRKAGLTIHPTKCYVGYDEVEFLGHKVSCNRIAMDENKLMKIQDAAPPKTKTQVRSFLGLTGYYRKFVNNYAHVTAPLTDLVKNGHPNKVEWIMDGTPAESIQRTEASIGKCTYINP